jgi:hypothetical protein
MTGSLLERCVTMALAVATVWTPISAHASAEGPAAPSCCQVVELRQYTLHPGQRDVLIELFDREFIETQEAEGMRILGQFRDLGDPDRFVWLRGFTDMETRKRGLTAFYGGPTWKAHRTAANATMVDATNVLLLRPVGPAAGFALDESRRPAPGTAEIPKGLVVATIHHFGAAPDDGFLRFFDGEVAPALEEAGARLLGRFVTEPGANTFPALPVREGEHVFVSFAAFPDGGAYERHLARLGGSARWNALSKTLAARLKRSPETLRLAPTARSVLGR